MCADHGFASQAYRCGISALERKLGGIVQDKNRSISGRDSLLGSLEVPGQDLGLTDTVVVEKSICSFGVSPVLARKWDASPRRG